jgi:hypothetical protein
VTAVRILVLVIGVVLAGAVLGSAVKTVVLPRAEVSRITRALFKTLRWLFDGIARPSRSFAFRDRVMAFYAPLGLLLLPALWVLLLVVGFTAVFWGTGVDPLSEAFVTSGSSLLTLGFVRPDGVGRVMISFIEASLGLAIVALMISYLPTIYGAFSRREAHVGLLEARAGLPPSPAELLIRYRTIGWLDHIDDELFASWEPWFIDIEESHTSPSRRWCSSARRIPGATGSRRRAAYWTRPRSWSPWWTSTWIPRWTSCCARGSCHCAGSLDTSTSRSTTTPARTIRSRSVATSSTNCAMNSPPVECRCALTGIRPGGTSPDGE